MQALDMTLEERVPARKHPVGFTSHRLEMIRAGVGPDPDPVLAVVDRTNRDVVNDLMAATAVVGQVVLAGHAVLVEAIRDWLDQPA